MVKQHLRRFNTYFRQTAREFASAKQAQVFGALKRNIPYAVHFSKEKFLKIKSAFTNILRKPIRK